MKYIADLHLHSKFSRATAKNLDFENLYLAAMQKGVTVVGTGDFTHPAWIEEIKLKLEPAEDGLFRLKEEYAQALEKMIPETCRGTVRFILQCEISSIYKKNEKVRKNHNLVYFPDIKSVEKFNAVLDTIGNIKSDGRPILGLDAKQLLKIMLDINAHGMFIPAHIWTPWFSLFGSKSGFDSIEECFEDLTGHIFAVETGLSSDPPMNWRIEDLDGLRLISSSDAHSPGMLGRNASVFNTQLSYDGIYDALAGKAFDAYMGTLDMYPDQGKYHYDGHRKCNICLNPATTKKIDGICPECGRPVTCGVLYRVQELASRPEGYTPENRHGYQSIIPLTDILSEIFSVGPKTKKVAGFYNRAIEKLGPELNILLDLSIDRIREANVPLLAEAVTKMRNGDIHIDPGFDGEYGVVSLFSAEERQVLKGEKKLLADIGAGKSNKRSRVNVFKDVDQGSTAQKKVKKKTKTPRKSDLLGTLNPEQKKAVEADAAAVVVQAGPGTGKTRTLTARIAWLVAKKNLDPAKILALTFTNKSARELSQRIASYIPKKDGQVKGVTSETFHSFCLYLLKTYDPGFDAVLIDDETRLSIIRDCFENKPKKGEVKTADRFIADCRQRLLPSTADLSQVEGYDDLHQLENVYQIYERVCAKQGLIDFEGLICDTVHMMQTRDDVAAAIRDAYPYVFIDEYQDLNYGQYALAGLLARGNHIFVIGDPDQSIYGFRGSDNKYFGLFETDFPGCEKIFLKQNYRSTQTILDASFQVMQKAPGNDNGLKVYSDIEGARQLILKETATGLAEAVGICKMIEKLIGGTSFFSMDAGRVAGENSKEYSFGDFAILCRTSRQAQVFEEVFEKEGIPYQSADSRKIFRLDGVRQLIASCRILADQATVFDFMTVFEHFKTGETEKLKAVLSHGPDRKSATSLPALVNEFKTVSHRDAAGLKKTTVDSVLSVLNLFCGFKKQVSESGSESNLPQMVEQIAQTTGLKDVFKKDQKALGAYEKIISRAQICDNLPGLLESLSLGMDADTLQHGVEKVAVMTLHAAKGLEFPVVFVTGCEQGLIPYARDGKNVENIEEERRLFYVGMTRAMDILCLTYAKKRSIYGRALDRQRSLFIEDIEKDLKRIEKTPFRVKVKKKEKQLELF